MELAFFFLVLFNKSKWPEPIGDVKKEKHIKTQSADDQQSFFIPC